MPVDAQFWLDRAGDARVARPVNCSKRVGDAYDTCSVFCRHYRMYTAPAAAAAASPPPYVKPMDTHFD